MFKSDAFGEVEIPVAQLESFSTHTRVVVALHNG